MSYNCITFSVSRRIVRIPFRAKMACAVVEDTYTRVGETKDETTHTLELDSYVAQLKKFWPRKGRHILAQYDDSSVVVYQAYNREIAKYAVENQR